MLADLGDRGALDEELQRDERLLWHGRPESARWLYPQDALLVPFSLMWGGFAIFWEVGVLSSTSARDSILFPLWGIPFVLAGLYLIFGRLIVRRWMRRRTMYAVTNRRVMSVAPSWRGGSRVNSLWLGSFPPLDKRIAQNGRGTLYIGTFPRNQRWLATDASWPGLGSSTGGGVVFADIPQAADVFSLISDRLAAGPSVGLESRE